MDIDRRAVPLDKSLKRKGHQSENSTKYQHRMQPDQTTSEKIAYSKSVR